MAEPADQPGRRFESRRIGRRRHDDLRQALVFHLCGAGVVALAAILWLSLRILLLIFSAVLFAILLHDLGRRLQRRLPLAAAGALAVVLLAALGVLSLAAWLLAPGVAEQGSELLEAVPESLQRLQLRLQHHRLVERLLASLPTPQALLSQLSAMLGQAGVFFSGLLGALADLAIVVVIGIYLAAWPQAYLHGLVTLVPRQKRHRARQVLQRIGHTLAEWLMGKLLSMLIVGLASALGLALLQVPLALVLGILAGLLDFIPYIGPILAGIPAVLIAFSASPLLALYVLLLFLALHAAEGYLLLPLIERRTVRLAPALIIVMQVLLGAFFGLAGVALATPLTATLAVLIRALYVEDVLGEPAGKGPEGGPEGGP